MGRAPKLRNASSASVNATPVFAVALDMCGVGTDCLLAPPPHRAGCSLTLPVLVNLGHGEEGKGSEDDVKEEEESEEEEEDDDDARPQSEKRKKNNWNNWNTKSLSSGPTVNIATPISVQVTLLPAFARSGQKRRSRAGSPGASRLSRKGRALGHIPAPRAVLTTP
jgi:hypothetical protein